MGTLRLTLEVQDFPADALAAEAEEWAAVGVSDPDVHEVLVGEWVYPDCGLTLVNIPGEKCQGHEFTVWGLTARIVAAEVSA